MNKQKFINLLQDFDNIADHERNKLHELAMNYPYSQIIHTLVAKANNDARTEIAGQTLNYAAMYATDRNVLKSIIQHAPANGSKIKAAVASQKNNTAGKNIADRITIRPDIDLEADHLRKKVWLDLAALKKSKASYMAWAAEQESVSDKTTTTKARDKNSKTAPAKSSAATVTKKEKIKKKAAKEKSEVKKGKAKALKTKTAAKKPEKKVSKPSKSKQSAPHEEQKKLIDNFISKEPRLSARPLKVSENQPDLSEASTAFNEDLVSENLAQIFIDQGKEEKAIDIYKKLIWKFPQKKAYFASRIEELKK